MRQWWWTCRPGLAAQVAHASEQASSIWHVAKIEAHASWVGNILDREACEIAITNGSPLVEQDLASMLKKHFQDVLTHSEQARAEDNDAEAEVA